MLSLTRLPCAVPRTFATIALSSDEYHHMLQEIAKIKPLEHKVQNLEATVGATSPSPGLTIAAKLEVIDAKLEVIDDKLKVIDDKNKVIMDYVKASNHNDKIIMEHLRCEVAGQFLP